MMTSRPRFQFCRAAVLALFAIAAPSAVLATDFTMTSTQFSPSPVDQSTGTASATLTLQPVGAFNGPVNLQCAVTWVNPPTSPPTCNFSQATVTPPAQPSVSLNFAANTTPQLYTVTITATSANTTATLALTDTVIGVNPDYTISVNTAISPSTLHAGSGATVIFNITPVSYTGTVTPVCNAITPAVALSPICTFNPPTVAVSGAAASTTTLTISTSGPATTTTTSVFRPTAPLLAFLLLVPGFAFCGFAVQRRPGRVSSFARWVLLAFMVSSILLLPSCSSMSSTSSNGKTPNNTYNISVSAVDTNNLGPSNSAVSVSLTVN